jgi:galactonate dehydratase
MSLNRRGWLQRVGAGVAGATWGRAVQAQTVQAQTSPSPTRAVITGLRVFALPSATYVKVETDVGVSGWGEGDHEEPRLIAAAIDQLLKPHVMGKNPFESEGIWYRSFFEAMESGTSGLVPGAIAGVDNALWDLKGKLLGVPVHHLLGGTGLEKVSVYGSYGRRSRGRFRTNEEMAKIAEDFVAKGYTAIKARMQIRELHKNPPFAFTYDCVKAVRQAIGDKIALFVDFNNGYTPAKAIHLGLKLCEDFNVTVIEEPVSNLDYPGLRQVVDALPCDVNAGEHEYTKWQFRDLITVGNPDMLNLDTIKCGGITECRKVAAMAEAFNKEVMVHNTRPTLATAASLQLCASIPNAARLQEFAGMRPELNQTAVFENSLRFENGFLYVPTTPGLGLIVNEQEMERRNLLR